MTIPIFISDVMPDTPILTIAEAIAAVDEMLDRPGEALLPASLICSNLWFQLDKILLVIEMSDRTFFLQFAEFAIAKNAVEYVIGELELFGSELALEIVDRTTGVEIKTPVPLLSDMRDLATAPRLSASLVRDPANPGAPVLRFSEPLAGTYRFRLWYEPGVFGRPAPEERPVLPQQAMAYWVALGARACISKLADAYTAEHFESVNVKVTQEVSDFGALFTAWSRKDVAGTPHRKAFNEQRRGQGRYGGGFRHSRKGPIVGS